MKNSKADVHAATPHRHILVADDDPILCELMHVKLSAADTSVSTVLDGASAWDRLTANRFDLAIIDLNMPQLNGFELIRHVRENPATAELPIVVVTSRNDDEAINKSFAAGATSFITKPINWSLLNHQLRFVLRSSETRRELRQARISADLANRTKDNLFQLLSHELRTPLNVLVGFADVLRAELRKTLQPDQKEHLDNMTDAAMRLNSVVGDVLTYSRLFAGKTGSTTESCSLQEILEDSAVMVRSQAQARGVSITPPGPQQAFLLRADRRQMLDAVHRLIDNAVKFSPKGTGVRLSAVHTPGVRLDICIEDDGPGISPERLVECLKPFFQIDMSLTRSAEGLGLGLAIAKKICELHDGQLIVEAADSGGTRAIIRLPASRITDRQAALSA